MKGDGGAGQFQGVTPWLQTAWDMRAAGNFIGGGTGTGLLFLAAIAALAGGGSPLLVVVGLIAVAGGLFSVFLEIGRPFRSLNTFLGGRRSWMTREAYVAMALFPLGLASLVWPAATPFLLLLVLPYIYCQARMLKEAKGIPAWREPAIIPLIMASALAEGAGLFALLTAILGRRLPPWALLLLLLALGLRAGVWLVYRRRLASGGAPTRVVPKLARFTPPFLFAGHAVPLFLLVVAAVLPSLLAPLAALAGVVVLLAGWAMKAFIITRIALNQGFAIPVTPVRGKRRKGVDAAGTAPGWHQ